MEFALLPNSDGNLYVFESGVNRGVVSTYTTTDVFRVAVEGGVVKYRKNGTLVYTSTVAPVYPLLVDAGLYHNGGTQTNVVISDNLIGGETANINWLVADQLVTPRMVFDKSGSLAAMKRHDYLPFGEELFAGVGGRTTALGYTADNPAHTIRQKFTSKERDNETGLDYFGARYYASTQGRFTSADAPLMDQHESEPQSWNLYVYAGNNPILFTDPTGLWKWVDPDKNGNRFIQWEEDDDWYTLSEFLYKETGRDYLPSDLEAAYSSGGLGADTIIDYTGAPSRFFTNNRGGVRNVTFEHLANISPTGRGAKAAGGLLSRFLNWIKGSGTKSVTQGLAKRTVREIAEELGYYPSNAVKEALKGRIARESIPVAEREIAAKFYERVANEVVSGPKETAAKALNLARAKFLREGGKPPIDIHGFEP